MSERPTSNDGPTNTHRDRSRLYRARAMILRRRDYGETDRILTVYTDVSGKITLLARGVRKTTSRLAGNLEPFAVIDLLLARGRTFDIVSQVQSVQPFRELRADEERIAYAGYLAELTDSLSAEDQENLSTFTLLRNSYQALDDGVDPWMVARQFEIGLLSLTGFAPELHVCVSCNTPLQQVPNGFSALAGGVLCDRCVQYDPGAVTLSVDALKVLRAFERGELSALQRVELSQSMRDEVESILIRYVSSVLEREPRSYSILKHITSSQRNGPS